MENAVIYAFGLMFLVMIFWMAVKFAVIGIVTTIVAAIWIFLIAVFLYFFWRLL